MTFTIDASIYSSGSDAPHIAPYVSNYSSGRAAAMRPICVNLFPAPKNRRVVPYVPVSSLLF
ncbi:MAG TPA: hypothetical protein PLI57_06350 [Spirochaetota bacterium]|nr:hypothetical protein [Spirochaetota bacterium]